jgi:hypothetical protein
VGEEVKGEGWPLVVLDDDPTDAISSAFVANFTVVLQDPAVPVVVVSNIHFPGWLPVLLGGDNLLCGVPGQGDFDGPGASICVGEGFRVGVEAFDLGDDPAAPTKFTPRGPPWPQGADSRLALAAAHYYPFVPGHFFSWAA